MLTASWFTRDTRLDSSGVCAHVPGLDFLEQFRSFTLETVEVVGFGGTPFGFILKSISYIITNTFLFW